MPPTGTLDLLSRGRQTQIMVDYKFIIESPCERDHRRRRHRRRNGFTYASREYSQELDFAKLPKATSFVLRATRIY